MNFELYPENGCDPYNSATTRVARAKNGKWSPVLRAYIIPKRLYKMQGVYRSDI